jgi:hypothetical protein
VLADKSTAKMMRVKLPARLEKLLPVQNGTPVATKLQVRVLSSRFGKRFTSRAKSPLVGPKKPPAPPKPKKADPNGDCDGDGQINRDDTNDDNDLLTDKDEDLASKLLDVCNSDTDGDGVDDGYEYHSARDLNDDEYENPNEHVLYPRTLPYPNPLDGRDGGVDHDGDELTLVEEFKLWNHAGRTRDPLAYSAGEQYSASERAGGSGNRTPTLDADDYRLPGAKQGEFRKWANDNGYGTVNLVDINDTSWWDGATPYSILNFDRSPGAPDAVEDVYYDRFQNGAQNGKLDDSERDEDADGLTNVAETRGCMQPIYWSALYKQEKPYPVTYEGTLLDNPDSDGDGILDGADDQDHDDVPNVMECSRYLASGQWTHEDLDDPTPIPLPDGRPLEGWVNPFNPCLPHRYSRTCKAYVTIGDGWAPWNTKAEHIYRIYD